jgi:hypothetical protein
MKGFTAAASGGRNRNRKIGKTTERKRRAKTKRYHFRTRGLNRVFFLTGKHRVRARLGPCAKSPNRTGGAIALKARARLHPAGDPRSTPVIEVLYPSLGVHTEAFWSAVATKQARPRRFSLVLKRAIAAGARISWRRRSQKPLYAPLS